jgi:hypothetical protein
MRYLPVIIFSFLLFASCEKSIEFTDEGYFDGHFNGNIIISENLNNKYRPRVFFINDSYCLDQGKSNIRLGLDLQSGSFASPIRISFLIDDFDKIKDKKYINFNHLVIADCSVIPQVSVGLISRSNIYNEEKYYYTYFSNGDNYLEILKLKEDHIIGHFKIKFIRKQFLEQGIESFDKHLLPDSLFIECNKFIAVNED